MDAIDAIQRRTSVRRFRPDPVPRETLERLLECAVRAPNHKLTEPWRFAVVTGAARARLADIRARHRLKRWADPTVPEAVAAGEKVRQEAEEHPGLRGGDDGDAAATRPPGEEDFAAAMMAIENLMIAAESLGLGTYLRTGAIMREQALVDLVGLAAGFRIAGVISVGYPVERETPRRRRPAAELTRWVE